MYFVLPTLPNQHEFRARSTSLEGNHVLRVGQFSRTPIPSHPSRTPFRTAVAALMCIGLKVCAKGNLCVALRTCSLCNLLCIRLMQKLGVREGQMKLPFTHTRPFTPIPQPFPNCGSCPYVHWTQSVREGQFVCSFTHMFSLQPAVY